MTPISHYERTPIPADARMRARFMVPLWFAIIFSPFVAFTANGKVDDSNWTPAVITAGIALLALVLLHVRARSNYANLPAWHRDEYAQGRLFAASARHGARATMRAFKLAATHGALRLSDEGIAFSPAAWLGADAARRAEAVRMLKRAVREGRMDVVEQAIAWRDIAEWQVHDESDTSDYYRVHLKDGGHIRLHRPAKAHDEYELLDAVRSIGQIPVRLFCDIPRP
jgi:hypothetical protein